MTHKVVITFTHVVKASVQLYTSVQKTNSRQNKSMESFNSQELMTHQTRDGMVTHAVCLFDEKQSYVKLAEFGRLPIEFHLEDARLVF